jgi:hypothetical protein
LNDHDIGTSVAAADPPNHSFPTQQTDNLFSFATGYSSTRQIGLRRELTKSLVSETIPNHQEMLATPSPQKKKNNKKATPVLHFFFKETHSSVSPEYKSENISTNDSRTKLPGRELFARSAWNMYLDPWNEERHALMKDAASRNVLYTFFYDMFLNSGESHWGEGNNVFHYLTHTEILTLLSSLHDLLPLMTYKFVFMLPLWRMPTQRDRLQCLVTAIHTNPHLLLRPNRFLSLLWAARCENLKCMVKEFTRKLVKVVLKEGFPVELLVKEYIPMVKTVMYRQTPFNGLNFLMATWFLVGICPTCLQLQVTNMLLAACHHCMNTVGTHFLYQIVPRRLAMVDNTYYLKMPWKDNWGNSVGSKFIQSFYIFSQLYHFLPSSSLCFYEIRPSFNRCTPVSIQ